MQQSVISNCGSMLGSIHMALGEIRCEDRPSFLTE